MSALVERATDAARANAILNHPVVYPYVAERPGPIDLSRQAANPDNYLLVGDSACALFAPVIVGTYEVHSASLPEARGAHTLAFARACLDWMFTRTTAWEIVTRIPRGHLPAAALAKACGYTWEYDSPNPCCFMGRNVVATVWRLGVHDWVSRSRFALERGQWLHRRMGEEAARLGVKEPQHEDNDHHSRVTGAAIEMARQGHPLKGVLFYSRWSILARHATVQLVSVSPPVLKMDLGLMSFRGDDIEVARDEISP